MNGSGLPDEREQICHTNNPTSAHFIRIYSEAELLDRGWFG